MNPRLERFTIIRDTGFSIKGFAITNDDQEEIEWIHNLVGITVEDYDNVEQYVIKNLMVNGEIYNEKLLKFTRAIKECVPKYRGAGSSFRCVRLKDRDEVYFNKEAYPSYKNIGSVLKLVGLHFISIERELNERVFDFAFSIYEKLDCSISFSDIQRCIEENYTKQQRGNADD
ncbi:MAG: hypothetical protein ACRCZB_04940 [Bacteroidales bacterium]